MPDIITKLPSTLEQIEHEHISGASFKLLEVTDEIGSEKKAVITLYSVQPPEFHEKR
jgi:hypothetical protein